MIRMVGIDKVVIFKRFDKVLDFVTINCNIIEPIMVIIINLLVLRLVVKMLLFSLRQFRTWIF